MEMQENMDDERSHSSSSSSGAASSKFSHLDRLDLPPNENDVVASLAVPVNTVESLRRLPLNAESFLSNSNMSDNNISTSANTKRTSNTSTSRNSASPPNCILGDEVQVENNTKRSIFGKMTKKKYNVGRHVDAVEKSQSSNSHFKESPLSDLIMEASSIRIPYERETGNHSIEVEHMPTNKNTPLTPPHTPGTEDDMSNPPPMHSVGCQTFSSPNLSPLTPLANKTPKRNLYRNFLFKISDEEESSKETTKEYSVHFNPTVTQYNNESHPSNQPDGDVVTSHKSQDGHHHAQALLLSLAFFFIWSPQNLLAPNLTQAAYDFGYGGDTHARDLYLGSNLALASSVLSLPFSALIGFASDIVSSRRILISITIFVGGMAAIATGMATSYPQLILSRFVGGSCMSGSVPVVFSLLSDWFHDKDRNAASSGFTAMMGAGIILGQIYAGFTGPTEGWRHSFYISGVLTMICAVLVMVCVSEPIRGGKEQMLQEMLNAGKSYQKKLTWSQFASSMMNHSSNCLLMLQGFFANIPWGVMFVFLNDFLSQEKGLTVPAASFIIAVFGVGCAVGGILGGFLGSAAACADRLYLPLFMSLTTLLGIAPFLALLDDSSYNHASFIPCFYAFAGGCLASMPSVNVRPCIISVNPPEVRGAVLTSANLIINAARGAGPSFLTNILMGIWGFNRAVGFNIVIIAFWSVTSIQFALLAKTLPMDQERMETELTQYANSSMDVGYGSISMAGDTRDGVDSSYCDDTTFDGSLYSIENQASSFDAIAARQSFRFMGDSLREISDSLMRDVTKRPSLAAFNSQHSSTTSRSRRWSEGARLAVLFSGDQ